MRALLPLLLVAPLLSGCLVDQLRGLEPPAPEATVLPWGLTDCTFVIAVVPVPAARLEGRLPPGFTPLTPAEAGLPSDPRGDATLGVEAWRCAEGVGHDGIEVLHDVPYGAVFTFVQPPEGLVVNGSRFHFVKWDVLVPDAARRALLVEAGVPAHAGNVTFSQFRTAADKTLFDVEMELNDTYAMRGSSAAPDPSLQAFAFTEYTATPHGLVAWRTNVTAATVTAGSGLLVLPPGMARDVVGADQAQAYYMAGTGGAFSNGTITLPPRAIP